MKNAILALLLFPLIANAAPPSASDRLALKEILGSPDVKVLRQGKTERSETVQRGAELFVGDVVETAARQVLTLEAFDGSLWKVAPGSSLKIEARVPQKKDFFHWTFAMEKGAMWGKVEPRKDADGFRLKVKTRNAAMGVRGTEYLIETKEGFTGLDVIEGTVWFGNSSGFQKGTYVEVKAGEHAEIGPDGHPKPATPTTLKGSALPEKYGLGAPAPEKEGSRKPVTPEDCRAQGKGWQSKDGSSTHGECVNNT